MNQFPEMNKILYFFFLLIAIPLSLRAASPDQQTKPELRFPFIENKGQWPADFFFSTSIPGGKVFLGKNEFRFHLIRPPAHGPHKGHNAKEMTPGGHVYSMEFAGASTQNIEAGGKTGPALYHFLLGNDPEKWGIDAACSEDVLYRNVYPGIDLKVKGGTDFKYDFILKPGADPKRIRLRFSGVDNLSIRKGRLLIPTSAGLVEEHIPYAFQVIAGREVAVDCRFRLQGKEVSFIPGKKYDARYPLVIDPALKFFTYSGSLSDNWGSTAASDRFGNGYLAGTVYGNSFPVTLGAYDLSFNGNPQNASDTYDIGIQKFSPDGSQMLYCTFLGGNQADNPHSINVDAQGNLLIMGSTSSLNFPVVAGAFQLGFAGGNPTDPLGFGYTMANGSDLFISRLSATGNLLLNSTFIGGSGNDGIMETSDTLVMNYGDQYRGDIAIAPDNGVVVSSYTTSSDFPLNQAFQQAAGGQMEGIVFRLSADFSQLVWSTYLGGSGNDALLSVHLQGNNKVLVCGGSTSLNFPVTPNAINAQAPLPGSSRSGRTNAVVSSFQLSDGSLLSSTYLGSSLYDQAYLVESDDENNVYILGQTLGPLTLSAGVFGSEAGTILLMKCNPDLTAVAWQTKIGASGTGLVPSAFLVDSCERIYFSGWGGTNNYGRSSGFMGGTVQQLPTTSGAIKATSTTSSEFYFAVLSPDAKNLEFGSFFGGASRGEHVDGGMSRFDKSGTITQAVCGCRSGNNFIPGTAGAYSQNILSGNCNQGLIKMELGILRAFFSIFASTTGCNNTVNFSNQSLNGLAYTWYFGDGDSLVSTAAQVSHIYPSGGTYIVTLYASNPFFCKNAVNIFTDTITVNPQNNLPVDTLYIRYCPGDTFQVTLPFLPGVTRTWLNTTYFVSPPNTSNPVIAPAAPLLYPIRNVNLQGCSTISYVRTLAPANQQLSVLALTDEDKCSARAKVRLKAISNGSEFYRWNVNGQVFTGDSLLFENPTPGPYRIVLFGVKQSCRDSAEKKIEISPYDFRVESAFAIRQESNSCEKKSVFFENQTKSASGFLWDFGDGRTSIETNPVIQYEKKGKYRISLIAANTFCRDTAFQMLDFSPVSVPSLVTLNDDEKNDFFELRGFEVKVAISVFNRWGKAVFESENYQNNWPASREIEHGVYFIHLKPENGQGCRQWVLVEK